MESLNDLFPNDPRSLVYAFVQTQISQSLQQVKQSLIQAIDILNQSKLSPTYLLYFPPSPAQLPPYLPSSPALTINAHFVSDPQRLLAGVGRVSDG